MPKRSQVQGDNSRITSVVVVVQNLKKRRYTSWKKKATVEEFMKGAVEHTKTALEFVFVH